MPGSWPKNGLFIVRAENGKYWAETIAPGFLEEWFPCSAREAYLFTTYINPAMESLHQQVNEERAKHQLHSFRKVMKKVINAKAN